MTVLESGSICLSTDRELLSLSIEDDDEVVEAVWVVGLDDRFGLVFPRGDLFLCLWCLCCVLGDMLFSNTDGGLGTEEDIAWSDDVALSPSSVREQK